MRRLLGVLLAMGALACSAGSSDSSSSGGGTTTSGATGTSSGGDTGGNSGGSSTGTSSGGIPVTGTPIGELCDSTHACHDAQDCVTAAGGKQGFCTIECGTTPGSAKVPPDGGPQLCAEAPVEGGTPACDLSAKNANGTLTWSCGLECGDSYGTCPTGLSCSSMNICQ